MVEESPFLGGESRIILKSPVVGTRMVTTGGFRFKKPENMFGMNMSPICGEPPSSCHLALMFYQLLMLFYVHSGAGFLCPPETNIAIFHISIYS